jgi:galactosyl transferase GMA12/MNN10 family
MSSWPIPRRTKVVSRGSCANGNSNSHPTTGRWLDGTNHEKNMNSYDEKSSPTCFNHSTICDDDDDDDDNKRRNGGWCCFLTMSLSTSLLVTFMFHRGLRRLISRSLQCVLLVLMMIGCNNVLELKKLRYQYDRLGSLEKLAPIVQLQRKCPNVAYETTSIQTTITNSVKDQQDTRPICITTLTDEKHRSLSQRLIGWRDYRGILPLTWKNKQDYATKHGYILYDESDQVDNQRPPGWSKIRAVRRLLLEENCSWVFWMDADTIIMDSSRPLQTWIPKSPSYHLVITKDLQEPQYNNGVWFLRNSPWSLQFLEDWWKLTSFVQPVGKPNSGDQASMNALLRSRKEWGDDTTHVAVPPQCSFNSFTKMVAHNEHPVKNLINQSYYHSEYYFHDGDFLAHAAGVENKVGVLKKMLELAR